MPYRQFACVVSQTVFYFVSFPEHTSLLLPRVHLAKAPKQSPSLRSERPPRLNLLSLPSAFPHKIIFFCKILPIRCFALANTAFKEHYYFKN